MQNTKKTRFQQKNQLHQYNLPSLDDTMLLADNTSIIDNIQNNQLNYSQSNHQNDLSKSNSRKSPFNKNSNHQSLQKQYSQIKEQKYYRPDITTIKDQIDQLERQLKIFKGQIVQDQKTQKSYHGDVLMDIEQQNQKPNIQTPIANKRKDQSLLPQQIRNIPHSIHKSGRQAMGVEQITHFKNKLKNLANDPNFLKSSFKNDVDQMLETQSQPSYMIRSKKKRGGRDSLGNIQAMIQKPKQFDQSSVYSKQLNQEKRKSRKTTQGGRLSLVSKNDENVNSLNLNQRKKDEPRMPPGQIFIDGNWSLQQKKLAVIKYFSIENIIKRIEQYKLEIFQTEEQLKKVEKVIAQIVEQQEKVLQRIRDKQKLNAQKKKRIDELKQYLLSQNCYKRIKFLRDFQKQNQVKIYKLQHNEENGTSFYVQFQISLGLFVKIRKQKHRQQAEIKLMRQKIQISLKEDSLFVSDQSIKILKNCFIKHLARLDHLPLIIKQLSLIERDIKRFQRQMQYILVSFDVIDLQLNSSRDKMNFKLKLLPELTFWFDIDLTNLYIADVEFVKILNLRENIYVQFNINQTKSENPIFNIFYNLVQKYITVKEN